MKNIVKLDQSVINRIAAGEIIHHPYNAVKELMENSLDAGAKHIHITLMNGGLELIKIKDNGSGIQVEDMPLVCERYSTSKLSQYQDLHNLRTFGFRGEALASLSHIAKVTIVSKTSNSSCAYQALYEDGKIISKPKPCAGNQGTIITIQNLFDTVPSRKKALKSSNEEYHRILDCVQKYAIHNINVTFALLKGYTPVNKDITFMGQSANNQMQRIQKIYGSLVSSCIKFTEYQDSKWKFTLYFSDMSKEFTNDKATVFIMFANNRLVENTKIKKAIKKVYSDLKSNYKPLFVYVSLQISPTDIDVNVHPTKNQVHLLDEDKIISKLAIVLDQALSDIPETSKMKKQRNKEPLPKEATIDYYFKKMTIQRNGESNKSSCIDIPPSSPKADPVKRCDIKEHYQSLSVPTQVRMSVKDINNEHMNQVIPPYSSVELSHRSESMVPSTSSATLYQTEAKKGIMIHLGKMNRVEYSQPIQNLSIVQHNDDYVEDLDSIRSIQQIIKDTEEKSVSILLAHHTFIGVIDDVLAIIMYRKKLYLINYPVVSEEYFYQRVICHFGKFGKLLFNRPVSIEACLALTLAEDVNSTSAFIYSHKDLLQVYFKIEIVQDEESGFYLKSLPMISENYVPSLNTLPDFLFHLATHVDWKHEQNCLDAIARELALLYRCNNGTEWGHVSKALHLGELKASKVISNRGYLVELCIPEAMMNATSQ